MAFSKIAPKVAAPATPDLLFRELPRRKFPDVLPHQQSMMQRYAGEAVTESDVALQLPTGSGKTLVGLLIAEWRRRKYQEKVVYLCPTKQLVHQVVAQAEKKYGLSVVGFTGSRRNYSAIDMSKYNQGDCVAVTTYSSLFNTNPYFSDADIIIVDDAHAAENYVASLWTLSINRLNADHAAVHEVLAGLFRAHLDPVCYSRLVGEDEGSDGLSWVDKLPTPVLYELHDEICAVLGVHTSNNNLQYAWSMLRDHLRACHIYFTPTEIFIRPLVAPTWTHSAFQNAKQRIYMSATLGAGGDLERLLGRKRIHRLPVPVGWDSQGVGRRFFIFPSLSLNHEETIGLRRSLMQCGPRSLVLVPSEFMAREIAEDVNNNLSLDVYSSTDIEESKDDFVASRNSVAIVANRYDGIDFPGEECRLLFIEGLPRAVNAQERFLMSRMGANVLFNERIQTRIIQAIGRCTRSLEDYSAVVVTGDELPDYLADPRRRDYFHPELQAELWFGVEQSKEKTLVDFGENFSLFIENGEEWEDANQAIVEQRNISSEKSFPCIEQLAASVKSEVEYQMAMWQQDYVEALSQAESVIGTLVGAELRGYRALWEYLAGSAAQLAAVEGNSALIAKSREHYSRAKAASQGIPWLVKLARVLPKALPASLKEAQDELLMLQVERIESVLTSLGTAHDRKYLKREKEVLEGLAGADDGCDRFENAHKLLGEHMGFSAGKEESDASPDPWWQLSNICIVFEDHANAEEGSSLDATKARQVATHPAWMKENVESCRPDDVEILAVLVTPVSRAHHGAMPHLATVYLWQLDDFREWAVSAMATIRELRREFVEAGDLVWRMHAAETIQARGLDVTSLVHYLKSRVAKDLLA